MPDNQDYKDLEALKALKARYCRLLDSKQWLEWRELFAEHLVSDTSEAGGKRITGADAFTAFVEKTLGNRTTVHHVHAPELELVSSTTARGIWALEDYIRFMPGLSMRGYGHYHETYEKIDGRWLIASSKLTRLREDIITPVFSLYIPDWLRQKIVNKARQTMD